MVKQPDPIKSSLAISTKKETQVFLHMKIIAVRERLYGHATIELVF